MTRKTIWTGTFTLLALAITADLVFAPKVLEKTAREFSSISDDPKIQILKSIPIMTGIEKPKANEDRITNQLIDIFHRFAAHNKNADGSFNRGTHAKGSCFDGSFTIFSKDELRSRFHETSDLAERLKQGLYAESGSLYASLRFANADGLGRKQGDGKTDVRGFSFSVTTPDSITSYAGDHRQDFMNNSTPAFATGEIHEFLELVKIALVGVYRDFTYVPNLAYLPSLLASGVFTHGNDSGLNTLSFAKLEYWDNLPYSHGLGARGLPKDLVKYKLTPCDGKGAQHITGDLPTDPNYLQSDIVTRAAEGSVCFLFQVQFFDLEKQRAQAKGSQKNWNVTDWVENGGLLWSEDIMPFHTVAKIEIPQGAKPITCDDQFINTRLHSSRVNQPLGSIARVRTIVEETSRARRMHEAPNDDLN